MSAAAVIAVRRKRLVRCFREAGATVPERAVTLEALGERRTWIFDQMARDGVFVATADGRHYMDEDTATAFLNHRRKRALAVTALLLLVALLIWLVGWAAGW